MFKSKKLRTKVEVADESDDEDETKQQHQQTVNKKASFGNKGTSKPALSFADDEEECADGEEFTVKKSRASKNVKRMRQAPGIMQNVEAVLDGVEQVGYASTGGSYSADSLAALRQTQHFKSLEVASASEAGLGSDGGGGVGGGGGGDGNASSSSSGLEGIELVGEDAEIMEEQLEGIDEEANNVSEMRNARLLAAAKHVRRGGGAGGMDVVVNEEERIFTDTPKFATKEFVPLSGSTTSWEDEIIKRGGMYNLQGSINNNSNSNSSSSSSNSSINGFGKGKELGGGAFSLSMADIRQAIQHAQAALSESTSSLERKLEQLNVGMSQTGVDGQTLKDKVGKGVENVNRMQQLRIYLSEVVGMLREKEPMIMQLRSATLQFLHNRSELVTRKRIEISEDRCFRVKEAGELLSLGGSSGNNAFTSYTPTAMLAAAQIDVQGDAEQGVDEFGRSRILSVSSYASASAIAAREAKSVRVRIFHQAETSTSSTSSSNSSTMSYASDEETTEGQEAAERENAETLWRASQVVLDDVRPEIGSVGEILRQLQTFRETLPDRYRAAFISLSLPALLEPLVLLDMLAEQVQPSQVLVERQWYKDVAAFSVDVDAELLSLLNGRVVLPWAVEVIQASLDPLLSSSCHACLSYAKAMLALPCHASSTANTTHLAQVILQRFETSLLHPTGDLALLPLVSVPSVLGVPFLLGQLKRITVALRNLFLFHELLPVASVANFAWQLLSLRVFAVIGKLLGASSEADDIVIDVVRHALALIPSTHANFAGVPKNKFDDLLRAVNEENGALLCSTILVLGKQ